jgi:transposase
MAKGYIPANRDQQFLVPPDMREWLPKGHLVWWILDVVDRLDTKALHRQRRRGGQGRAGYDPDMLLALLVYAYCTKVRSSRQIERLCETDIAYRVVCAGHVPDHSTIARFRQAHAPLCRQLFAQVLEICARAGLAQVGVVALDGTKVTANASKDANRSRAQLEAEVAAMFAEAQSTDDEEDSRHGPQRGDELPEGLASAEGRKARLEQALGKLAEREACYRRDKAVIWRARAEQTEQKLAAARQRWAEHQATKKSQGMKPRLPEGKEVARIEANLARARARAQAAKGGAPGAQVNLTDPDSRLMTSPAGWVQAYNAQAAVNYIGVIIAADVFTDPNDMGLFRPMLVVLAEAEPTVGSVGVVLADTGYCSAANLAAPGPVRLISTKKERLTRADGVTTAGSAPEHLGPVAAMAHTLGTPEGRHLYKQRSWTVEPGFGNIKYNLGFTRFSRRGREAARAEWYLVTAVANLLKLHRYYPAAARFA